jgi:hypothetical protein
MTTRGVSLIGKRSNGHRQFTPSARSGQSTIGLQVTAKGIRQCNRNCSNSASTRSPIQANLPRQQAEAGLQNFPKPSRGRLAHLLAKAKAADEVLPVVFADATDCSRLLYWGILTNIVIEGKNTRYSFKQTRKIKGRHSRQELLLKSTDKPIAPNFIRPYAICRTPFVSCLSGGHGLPIAPNSSRAWRRALTCPRYARATTRRTHLLGQPQ